VQRRQSFRASVTFSSIKVFKHNHPEGKYQVRRSKVLRFRKFIAQAPEQNSKLKICVC